MQCKIHDQHSYTYTRGFVYISSLIDRNYKIKHRIRNRMFCDQEKELLSKRRRGFEIFFNILWEPVGETCKLNLNCFRSSNWHTNGTIHMIIQVKILNL